MTTITTLRNRVIADDPEHDDVMVYVGWTGPSDTPGVRRSFATSYRPISEYQMWLDWAVSMADQMSHPLYVVPLSHNDIFRTKRWHPFRDFIAGMNDQERGELRRIVVTTAAEVMRDCDDPEIRADMFDVLRQLKVIHHES
ncbi:hypothetical protein OKW76_03145 [Sphingomonas sp. S1-29]|uniref:hypothetical protein n=1 Tax=Sphingomonas sp. S1-29 TaxID=2991074 RepID=UPI0022402ACE|nr:hypothetical protein [Sphingomonas sp. S1-29]UZK70064.1 hypothetical protein OKW76_03145 [Sphingomonas sp. S1-29]